MCSQFRLVYGEKCRLRYAPICEADFKLVYVPFAYSKEEWQELDSKANDRTSVSCCTGKSAIYADRILYIANKGIAEQGTHEELMAKKGLYYALNI